MKPLRIFLLVVLLVSTAAAERIRVTPDGNWRERLTGNSLKPGDELVLAPGTYSHSAKLELSHVGTAERPIIIRGEKGAIIKRPDARQNTLNLAGTQYLTIRDLEITGGSAGIRIHKAGDRPAKFVTLEGLHIHHIGGVAITCNHAGNHYEGMRFRNNHIHHTSGHGEAFYLGGNEASAIFFNGVVEGNYIHDLNGGKISQGDGIELKQGSYSNLVQRNVIVDSKYPGIIVYGTQGKAANVISKNWIVGSGDHGIQAASDAVIEHNLIAFSRHDAIHSKPHQGAVPGDLLIRNNTVVLGRGGNSHFLRVSADKALSGSIRATDNNVVKLHGGALLKIPATLDITVENTTVKPSLRELPKPWFDREHIAWQHTTRAKLLDRK